MNTPWWQKPSYTGDYSSHATIGGLPLGTSMNKEAEHSIVTDNDYYCDPCEKSFKLGSQLAAHIATHVSCTVVGCSFTACHRVVQEHISVAHSSSVKSSMFSLDSPEDIARWREARKQNWPSAANLKRKESERENQVNRGALMADESDRKRSRQRPGKWQVKEQIPTARASGLSDKSSRDGNRVDSENTLSQNQQSLASLLAYGSDSSDNEEKKTGVEQNEEKKTGDEQHEDNDEPPDEMQTRVAKVQDVRLDVVRNVKEKDESNDASRSKRKVCKFFESGHCSKGKWCKFAHEAKKQVAKNGEDKYQFHTSVVRRGPSLLERLLSGEDHRDTSRLLQCLRYLVLSGQVS